MLRPLIDSHNYPHTIAISSEQTASSVCRVERVKPTERIDTGHHLLSTNLKDEAIEVRRKTKDILSGICCHCELALCNSNCLLLLFNGYGYDSYDQKGRNVFPWILFPHLTRIEFVQANPRVFLQCPSTLDMADIASELF